MSRKIFIAVSVIMTVLFIFSAAARYAGSREFQALEARQKDASRDKWVKLTDICTGTARVARCFCRFYPAFILLVWLTDKKYFKTAIKIAAVSLALSALPWAMLPSLTGGRADGYFLKLYCQIYFTETSLVCVCVALSKKLYQYIKTISRP